MYNKNNLKIKKIFYLILGFPLIIKNTFGTLQEDIIPLEDTENAIQDTQIDSSYTPFILEYIRDSLFEILALIAIGTFIFIGARLVIARGNPEEFKKALMQFIYAIIGLALVAISWAAVKLVSSLNF